MVEENRKIWLIKNFQTLNKNDKKKPKDALNFLVPENILKKSWGIHTIEKNFLTKWQIEEEN